MEIIILMIIIIVSFVAINTLLLILVRKIIDLYHSKWWKGRIDE
jgi:hypothetical protein